MTDIVHRGHQCRDWPHCFTPTSELEACVDEVATKLADGTIEDPNGTLIAIVRDLQDVIAWRYEQQAGT